MTKNLEDIEAIQFKNLGKKIVAQKEHDTIDLVFMFKGAEVKWTPEKYDKITVDLTAKQCEFIKKLHEMACKDYDVINPLKEASLGLKISKEYKANNTFKRGERVDLVIRFNSIWTITGRNYFSFELVQHRKSKESAVDYFMEDELELVN